MLRLSLPHVVVINALHSLLVLLAGTVTDDVIGAVLESHLLGATEDILVPVIHFSVSKQGIVTA